MSSPSSFDDDQPLGLTVHSMSVPTQAAQQQAARTRSGRWKMLLVLLVCASPVLLSYFTYYVARWPQERRNFGLLIDPPRPVPDILGTTLEGSPVALSSLKGQWLFVSVASGACDAQCQHHLYVQRQLREALGKDKDRVDWVWLVSDQQPIAPALQPALKAATVLRVPEATLQQWLQAEPGRALADHLYLVDPMGQWMMRFPAQLADAQTSKVRRDMEVLLRASVSWDQAGR